MLNMGHTISLALHAIEIAPFALSGLVLALTAWTHRTNR